jgi:hypothetical protein
MLVPSEVSSIITPAIQLNIRNWSYKVNTGRATEKSNNAREKRGSPGRACSGAQEILECEAIRTIALELLSPDLSFRVQE